MVNLADIMGGRAESNWLNFKAGDGRGLPTVYKFVQNLESGQAGVAGKDDPIRLMEVGGRYFVESDGNHRVAALKALGVDVVPAMVSHVED